MNKRRPRGAAVCEPQQKGTQERGEAPHRLRAPGRRGPSRRSRSLPSDVAGGHQAHCPSPGQAPAQQWGILGKMGQQPWHKKYELYLHRILSETSNGAAQNGWCMISTMNHSFGVVADWVTNLFPYDTPIQLPWCPKRRHRETPAAEGTHHRPRICSHKRD